METIGKIRRWHRVEKKSISEIARRLGASRNTIKRYLRSEVIEPHYGPRAKRNPVMDPWTEKLLAVLSADAALPPKQRRTGQRIYEQLQLEGFGGSYITVSRFVRAWKEEQGRHPGTVFIPLVFAPGEAYQFDWSYETVELAGRVTAVKAAHLKLGHSRVFHATVYLREGQEMVFDAHWRAFRFFDGVPKRGIYDNLKAAVEAVFTGKARQYNQRFLRMTSHYLIEPVACTPAAGWEKGQIENQVGVSREHIFTPRLRAASLRELNELVERRCLEIAKKLPHIDNPALSRWAVFEQVERPALMSLPRQFEGFTEREVRVTTTALVHLERNRYSVEGRFAGRTVSLRAYADRVVMVSGGNVVGEHERSFERDRTFFNPWHYVDALAKKPGALRNGAPFKDWRLPEPILEMKDRLLERLGGDRQFVEILNAIRTDGLETVAAACEEALRARAVSADYVLNVLSRRKPGKRAEAVRAPQALELREAPKADVERYDRLLKKIALAALIALPAATISSAATVEVIHGTP